MDSRSRSSNRSQGAILFHHPTHAVQQKQKVFFPRGKAQGSLAAGNSHELFIVSEAYQEPGGCDYIEDILMQRDYIID
ncbi:MAG: hypothetical protein ACR2PB_00890 [Desulfocapsaceae bacterium]